MRVFWNNGWEVVKGESNIYSYKVVEKVRAQERYVLFFDFGYRGGVVGGGAMAFIQRLLVWSLKT